MLQTQVQLPSDGFDGTGYYATSGYLEILVDYVNMMAELGSGITIESPRVWMGAGVDDVDRRTVLMISANPSAWDLPSWDTPIYIAAGRCAGWSPVIELGVSVDEYTLDYAMFGLYPGDSGANSNWSLYTSDYGNHDITMRDGYIKLTLNCQLAGNVEFESLRTLTGALTDGYAGSLILDPGYTAAYTVTRHNYLDCQNPSTAASAVVTDACLVRFDAAAGTHKAVDSGTTKTTPGAVDAWIKVNVNGTIHYIPTYTSKTA